MPYVKARLGEPISNTEINSNTHTRIEEEEWSAEKEYGDVDQNTKKKNFHENVHSTRKVTTTFPSTNFSCEVYEEEGKVKA